MEDQLLPQTASEVITKYQAEYLVCRDIGHNWQYTRVTVVKNKSGKVKCYDQVMSCNCGTQRIRRLSSVGELIANQYAYPGGYLVPSLFFSMRDHKPEIRMEVMNRSNFTQIIEAEE